MQYLSQAQVITESLNWAEAEAVFDKEPICLAQY